MKQISKEPADTKTFNMNKYQYGRKIHGVKYSTNNN